jgi:ribonuclease HI
MLRIWVDGSITNGPWGKKDQKHTIPHGFFGWVAVDGEGKVRGFASVDLGASPRSTGNTSEYLAVRSALKWVVDNNIVDQPISLMSDSQIVVNQINGEYQCHNPVLKTLYSGVRGLLAYIPAITIKWIRREDNTVADHLSKCLQAEYGGRQLSLNEVQTLCDGK